MPYGRTSIVRPTTCVLAAVVLVAGIPRAQTPDEIDGLVDDGKNAMYRLDYDVAEEAFGRIAESWPESPVGHGMMASLAWNRLLREASNLALDDYGTPLPYAHREIYKPIEDQSRRFHMANDQLVAVCERILATDPENVVALYFRGLADENLAAEALTISGDRWGAVGPGRRANSIHKDVLKLDPRFVDARVSVAAYEYALATVPAFAKIVLFVPRLFGFFRGNKDEAFELMASVGQAGRYRDLDAQVLLSIMQAFGGDPRQAVSTLENLRTRFPENYVLDLAVAAIQHHNVRDPRSALATYQALLASLPTKAPGLGEGEVLFRIGRTYLELDEQEQARVAFERALAASVVEAETMPLTYFHLGLVHEQQGSEDEARESYRQVVTLGGAMESLEDEVAIARRKLRAS